MRHDDIVVGLKWTHSAISVRMRKRAGTRDMSAPDSPAASWGVIALAMTGRGQRKTAGPIFPGVPRTHSVRAFGKGLISCKGATSTPETFDPCREPRGVSAARGLAKRGDDTWPLNGLSLEKMGNGELRLSSGDMSHTR
jgi:hypothetical protein